MMSVIVLFSLCEVHMQSMVLLGGPRPDITFLGHF